MYPRKKGIRKFQSPIYHNRNRIENEKYWIRKGKVSKKGRKKVKNKEIRKSLLFRSSMHGVH